MAGSSETHLVSKGAFQELDAVSLLTPHTKLAIRPSSLENIPVALQDAFRSCWLGRPGTAFVDLPADLIQGILAHPSAASLPPAMSGPLLYAAEQSRVFKAAQLLKSAKAPLVVIGKGAAHTEASIRNLIDRTGVPFLPTPMGKGVVSDSHPFNTSAARSTALAGADVVLLLGARLNWILHFGLPPKWSPSAKFIQVDVNPGEIGRNEADPELGLVGHLAAVVPQLLDALGNWQYDRASAAYVRELASSMSKNLASFEKKASNCTSPMTLTFALSTIAATLNGFSPTDQGGVMWISEGANTMDLSRSIFPVSHPRLRLDAGTNATMGVGLGYAIAAYMAYNGPMAEAKSGPSGRKKIVCLEGDSAFGFSLAEVETMARYGMDILIFVLNNGGVYHGSADSSASWHELQSRSLAGEQGGLKSTSLGWEVGYEKVAQMCGGRGFVVRNKEELERATKAGWSCGTVCVINVIVESGAGQKLEFAWQGGGKTKKNGGSGGKDEAKL